MVKKRILYCLLCLLFHLSGYEILYSQQKDRDVIDLEKKAEKLYRQQLFTQAKDVYSTLLSNFPKDPFYSYRFGVCLLYGDRRNIEKPVQYLELAAKDPDVDKEVFYYLGQAYHFNYRFTDAIRLYQKYRALVSDNQAARKDVDRQIEMCQNGLYLLSRVKDLYVIERKEVKKEDFYRNYDLSGFGGELLIEPPLFKSKLDLKKEKSGLVFFPKKQEIVLFSSYGKDGKNGKDIYFSTMLPDMTWSKPLLLPGAVNTPYDEDYPFLLPDGKTLYFSSKGHTSMGGYDIFRSVKDTLTGKWLAPENMDFAINTPFDDQLFVTDPYQHYAYFSSNRTSVGDNIMVYMVRVDRRPDRIQEITLEAPLAGKEEEPKIKRSVEIIKQMADLAVNAANDNYNDSIVALAVASIDRSMAKLPRTEEVPAFETTMDTKVKEKESLQVKVDSAFILADKVEESVNKLDKTIENLQKVKNLTVDNKQKELASSLLTALSKESSKKWNKLSQVQMLSGTVQQLAATGKADSVNILYDNLKNKILPSDTAADYAQLAINTASGSASPRKAKVNDDFLEGFKPVTSREDKKKLAGIFEIAQQKTDVVAFETKIISPKEEEPPVNNVIEEPIKPSPQQQGAVTEKATPPAIIAKNPEATNRLLNVMAVQKDSLNILLLKTQKQKIILLGSALEKSNESGSKIAEARKLEGVLATIITEGSSREIKKTINELKAEGISLAEEAILNYSLASKLGEREKDIGNALDEIESRSVTIIKTIDSGKVEKAGILVDVMMEPVRAIKEQSVNNDDILLGTHRQARELKINVLSNYIKARELAISAKTDYDLASGLKKQSEAHRDKKEAKRLLAEAEVITAKAASKQKEATELFNQNIIWQNRATALENSLPQTRKMLDDMEQKMKQDSYDLPRKKIKDTTLLIPVMLDLLSEVLPANDTVYEKLVSSAIVKNKPQPVVNNEIIARTEFIANVDNNVLAAQRTTIQEDKMAPEFREPDAKELELREKLAVLNDTLHTGEAIPEKVEPKAMVTQWENDKPSFLLLKNQVDTLYERVKKNPSLVIPSTLKGLFEELLALTDSMSGSYEEYRKMKMAETGRQDREKVAMTVELEAFEVKATVNRLRYLLNRLRFYELLVAIQGPEVKSRPQVDSIIATDYFFAADEKRAQALKAKDKKRNIQLLQQADELEKKGLKEQESLTLKMKEKPEEIMLAKVLPKENKSREALPSGQKEIRKQDEKAGKQQQLPVADKKTPEDKRQAVADTGRDKQEKTAPTENISLSPQIENTPLLQTGFLARPVKSFSPSEVSRVEKEITEASGRYKLPSLPGLMYTVQVGVYRTHRSPGQLFNINPLYEDIMNNGNFRYFSGIFGNREDAVTYKNLMIQKGIPDAFVVIFYQGRKISTAEAEALTGESITKIIPQTKINQLSQQKSLSGNIVYFSVQLAAYKRELTSAEQDFYRTKADGEVKSFRTEKGLTVLVTGEFKNYEASLEYRKAIINRGIADAFIVGFIDGKRVMAYQAREAINSAQ